MPSASLRSTTELALQDETVCAVRDRVEFVTSCPNQWVTVNGLKYACDVTTRVGLNADQRGQFVVQVGKINYVFKVGNRATVVIELHRGARIHQDDMVKRLVAIARAILLEEQHLTAAKRAIIYDNAKREKRERREVALAG